MKRLLFVAALFVLTACGQKADKEQVAAITLAKPQANGYGGDPNADISNDEQVGNANKLMPAPPEQRAEVEKKIIKEGDISFETGNVADTRKQLLASLKKLGGYVTEDNEYLNGDDNRKQYVLNVKIPAKNFDTFLGTVSESATKIDSKNIRVTDITTQYIDVKTRLHNKKALEQRYLSLLQKAGKMSDVLEIEAKLTEIRSDIESTQGQLNYMDKQVAYSSLSITFYTKQVEQADTGNTFGYKFKHALENGLLLMQSFFFGFIAWWPVWVVLIVAIVVIRNRRKRKE
ncbi:DUF4349 domain-containing protein [Mucilaginibacter limnophilus]|uniref:DUF4349 domain-containing protein n=1 Tax=Mucilaginibacter limnophilus TaxID=1932778 RepID=A0A3S2UJ69_9SPHI|nr:DUF4349 domain-containing protein [Mucilaginibacter limnophilus]RVT98151.1 DUF4349 domain-containing protein [Mucilaginibacter limnophilus]